MGQRGEEKGIDPEADYGQQFLNAKGSAPRPPMPPAGDGGTPPIPPSGRSVGQIVMIVILVLAVLGGGAALVLLSGGDSGSTDDDLITAGGVQIDEEGRVRTTTTEAPETTTTEAPETTTTEAPETTTTPPLAPTTAVAGFPPVTGPGGVIPPPAPTVAVPTTAPPPACPGGSVATSITGATVTIVGGAWKVDVSGTTTNNTTAAIRMQVTVPITYVDGGGATKTVTAQPAQYGQTVAPGASLSWSVSQPVTSDQQPRPGSPAGAFSWADPSMASCPTG